MSGGRLPRRVRLLHQYIHLKHITLTLTESLFQMQARTGVENRT